MRYRLTLILCLVGKSAFSENVVILPEISLGANMDAVEVLHTGVALDVLEREAIQNTRGASVLGLLDHQTGVSVEQTGPAGGMAQISIRGLRAPYVDVRVDGIEVSDPSSPSGAYDFSTLGLWNVGHIEILRGAQSALYGDGAVAGIVDIRTDRPEDEGLHTRVLIEAGTYDTYRGGVGIGSVGENHSVIFDVSTLTSQGFSAASAQNGNSEPDGTDQNRESLGIVYDWDAQMTFGLNGFWTENRSDMDSYDPVMGIFADSAASFHHQESGLRSYARYDDGRLDQELALVKSDHDRRYYDTYSYFYEGARIGAEYFANYDFSDRLKFSLKADHFYEDLQQKDTDGGVLVNLDGSEYAYDRMRDSLGVGLDYQPMDNLDVNLLARFDRYDDIDDALTGRLSMAYRPSEVWVLRGVLANGFRAPSLSELYDPYYGNPNLTPETALGYEFGVERVANIGVFAMTFFDMDTDNLIIYDPITFRSENLSGRSTHKGLEFSGQFPLATEMVFDLSYTFLDAHDAQSARIPRIPKHELDFGLSGDLKFGARYGLDAKFIQDVVETDGKNLDDYLVFDALLARPLDQGEIYARFENLTDEEYETIRGYGTAGRTISVGYAVDF